MLKKQYLKSRPVCKVTFYTAPSIEAETVYLVGDFNDWNEDDLEMQPMKDGRFRMTVELDKDAAYQFRYLVNGCEWHNDWEADMYVPNPYAGDNSVVSTSN